MTNELICLRRLQCGSNNQAVTTVPWYCTAAEYIFYPVIAFQLFLKANVFNCDHTLSLNVVHPFSG